MVRSMAFLDLSPHESEEIFEDLLESVFLWVGFGIVQVAVRDGCRWLPFLEDLKLGFLREANCAELVEDLGRLIVKGLLQPLAT